MRQMRLTVIGVALLLCAASAQAQTATFSAIHDARADKFFDAETTTADGNTLTFGFNVGSDPNTWMSNEFRASTLSFQNRQAADTLTFVVTAPEGFYIAGLTYQQAGTASTYRTAQQRGNTQWTVNGVPAVIVEYAGNPTLTSGVELQVTSVVVSVTVSLFAGPSGDIALTAASVTADIRPLPSAEPNGGVVAILD